MSNKGLIISDSYTFKCKESINDNIFLSKINTRYSDLNLMSVNETSYYLQPIHEQHNLIVL